VSIRLSRRNLIALGTTVVAGAFLYRRSFFDKHGPRSFSGEVIGANFKRGHRLLLNDFPKPSREYKRNVSIVGSGISGLSSAYHLKQRGVGDIEIFELEDHFGGKSSSFNGVAPWGAHYLPLANPQNKSLLSFLSKAEVVLKQDEKGVHYNPYFLCADPMEKLFIYGRVQDGIVPKNNLSAEDSSNFEKFFEVIEKLRIAKGRDGKFAFDIPMAKSSSDDQFLKYDKITMADYIKELGLNSPALRWYIDYCCRDDYGMRIDEISAWAGLHYFSSRRGVGVDTHDDSILTWPEGNNYLASKLKSLSDVSIKNACMLYKMEGKRLFFYDFQKDESFTVVSNQIILAIPQFLISRIMGKSSSFEYSPWMVANLEVNWDEEIEASLAWDNVNFHGKGVGFVSANHQNLKRHKDSNYLTYYWPLTHLEPKQARRFALKRTHEQWCKDILADMTPVIPDLEKRIKRIDIWPWGHAMVTAPPGFVHGKRLEAFSHESDFLHFAHTDLGGLSLFEEGFYRGEVAAKRVAKGLVSVSNG
jgi:hypothetical protein